jgi:hypothetical protein
MTQVALQRIEPGLYRVVIADGFIDTPLRVVRKRTQHISRAYGPMHGEQITTYYWVVEFDGKTTLGEIAHFKREYIPNWDYVFGNYSDAFDTLRDARLKLEEVLGGGESTADRESAEAHHGRDSSDGSTASGGRRG